MSRHTSPVGFGKPKTPIVPAPHQQRQPIPSCGYPQRQFLSANPLYPATAIATAGTIGDRWSLRNCYNASCSDTALGNGNILQQQLRVPEFGSTYLLTSYTYDNVNRLKTAAEFRSTDPISSPCSNSSQWCLGCAYDPFGNKTVNDRNTYYPLRGNEPSAISTATNRITTPGFAYNLRGDLTAQPGGAPLKMAYDGEGKMSAASAAGAFHQRPNETGLCTDSPAVNRTLYRYDAMGARVEKRTGDGNITRYLYDNGQLAAEYTSTPATESGRRYLTTDHLGTTRVMTRN